MQFWKDYFIDSKISNYQDYTKKKYWDLCEELIELFNIKKDDKLLDRWCATWNLVKEFVDRWYNNILGSDISPWAIEYGITNWLWEHLKHFDLSLLEHDNKYIIINDVLEHMTEKDIVNILEKSKWNIILRVPVCAKVWEDYVLECSRVDRTHIIRWTKEQRIGLFKLCWYHVIQVKWKHFYDSDGVLACILIKWQK